MNKITKFLSLGLAGALVIGLTACGGGDKAELVMATEAGFAPYEYYEGQEIVGVDVDIAKEIAKDLDKELVIKDIAFEGQNHNDPSLRAFMEGFENQTFRSIVLGSSGRVNKDLGDKILKLVNSEFIDAIKEAMDLIKEFKNMNNEE